MVSVNVLHRLRQSCRRARRQLPRIVQRHHSRVIAKRLRGLGVLKGRSHTAAYYPIDGELDLRPIYSLLQRGHRRLYLPVLRPRPQRKLGWVKHAPNSKLKPNRWRIPEPFPARCIPTQSLDLILLPLVAFDDHCNRLGMGGGFYDRTLAYLRHRVLWRKPRLIGVAHECQRVNAVPVQSWDVPLDCVLTEARVYRRKPRL